MAAKIDNVRLLSEPRDGARALSTLKKADELVVVGEEKDGYVKVQGAAAEGWAKKLLLVKR